MTAPKPPVPGTDPWGDDLNAYLASLENRIAAEETKGDLITQLAAYTYNAGAPPATQDQVRLDNTDQTKATSIDLRRLTSDGLDLSGWYELMVVGAVVKISDYNDSTAWQQYTLTAVPVLGVTNVTMPVTWQKGGYSFPAGKCSLFMASTYQRAS